MKVQLKVKPKIIVEVEDDKMVDVFETLSCAQEVFGESCARCGNEDIEFSTRKNDGSTFYELKCSNRKCNAILQISPHNDKTGNMFTRRYDLDEDKQKVWLKHRGWKIWDRETKSYE